MFDGPIIDVAIGLIFFYVVLSLICSAVQELVASAFGLRSRELKKGIGNLLGDKLANRFYEHPLIGGLGKHGKSPSYVRPSIFAAALLDVVARRDDEFDASALTSEQVHAGLERMEGNEPVRRVLLGLSRSGADSVEDMRDAVADWYEEAMDRVAGWYKRQVQWILLLIAAFVTVAVNADSIRITKKLWYDDQLRATVVGAAEPFIERTLEDRARAGGAGEERQLSVVRDELEKLQNDLGTFPIGYPEGFNLCCITWSMILGWLLTIGAISLGAPFWFDLLGKVSHLRGSGTKEADRAKKPGATPAAVPANASTGGGT